MALNGAGTLALFQADYVTARSLHTESLAIRRKLADRQGAANSLNNLGNVANGQGDYTAARALQEESLEIRRELGDHRGMAYSIGRACRTGAPLHGIRLWGAAERLREEVGSPMPLNECHRYEHQVAAARVALVNATAFDSARQEGRAMSL